MGSSAGWQLTPLDVIKELTESECEVVRNLKSFKISQESRMSCYIIDQESLRAMITRQIGLVRRATTNEKLTTKNTEKNKKKRN
jgi:hypothetical protein